MQAICASIVALTVSLTAQAGMAEKISRTNVGGIDVIIYPTSVKDVVTIVGTLPAGDAFAGQGNPAVPTLVGMMLDRGTMKQNKFSIAEKLENAGATLTFGVDNQTVDIRARCLAKDLPMVIGLLAEQLREPAFAADEFERARQQFIGSMRGAIDKTDFRAHDAFNREIFPPGHPNRPVSIEQLIAAARTASAADAKAFHRKLYGPAHMTLVMVGDLKVAPAQHAVGESFAGWSGGAAVIRVPAAATTGPAHEETVQLAGKTSVTIVLGQATGLQYKDQDTLALRVAAAILGSGFSGRLMSTVRDREGLTYGISAGIMEDTFNDGAFDISATFAPQLLSQGLVSTRRELQKWWADGVTAAELKQRQENMIGTYEVGLSATTGIANALLAAVQRGYGVEWIDQYPEAIRALSVEQVNTAIKKYLNPGMMSLVQAGSIAPATATVK